MPRGITIRIERAVAIRELGRVMRQKTQQFERDKKEYPRKLQAAKNLTVKALRGALKRVRNGIDHKHLAELMASDIVPWRERAEVLPDVPSLNLCEAKSWLDMLQKDVRKVIPVNSNSTLWTILKDRCEVVTSTGV